MTIKLLSCIATSFCLSSTISMASEISKFAPDNDLWQEDVLESISNIDSAMFNKIIDKAMEVYEPIASRRNEEIIIHKNWDDSTVNANCSRSFGIVSINMYGGLARRPEVTPDGFAMVLCHELGHAYGGLPYISSSNQMSAEGQSDYYSAKTCVETILPSINNFFEQESAQYITKTCATKYGKGSSNYNMCVRQLNGGQSLGNLLAKMQKETAPNFETPDKTVVSRTLTSYPATVQCRLDTYHNGTLDLARPACWFRN